KADDGEERKGPIALTGRHGDDIFLSLPTRTAMIRVRPGEALAGGQFPIWRSVEQVHMADMIKLAIMENHCGATRPSLSGGSVTDGAVVPLCTTARRHDCTSARFGCRAAGARGDRR